MFLLEPIDNRVESRVGAPQTRERAAWLRLTSPDRRAAAADVDVTAMALGNANEIEDIVLRELQAAMDLEEVRVLGPPPTE